MKTVHGLSQLEIAELAYVAYRKLVKELELKPSQLRTEKERIQLREARKQMNAVRKEIKSFQLRLF